MVLITLITIIINFILGWYVLFTIPIRLNKIIKKLDNKK